MENMILLDLLNGIHHYSQIVSIRLVRVNNNAILDRNSHR